ncbi:MAG: hypothetical protein H0X26_10585, partial [Alphaproteobacteria bacterium]|nr:hypothetical protein [Alphaproteobacteria bacterium]
MQNDEFFFPQAIYLAHLKIIDGIPFTPREIDVIACLVHVRGTGKIASLLNISKDTVFTYIKRVKEKLKCNSRDSIVDFIEKSRHHSIIRKYYLTLTSYAAFEKSLKACSKQTKNPLLSLIVYCNDQQCRQVFEYHLNAHLKLAGIEVEVRTQAVDCNSKDIKNEKKTIVVVLEKEKHETIAKERTKFSCIDLREQRNYYFVVFEILKKLCPEANFEQIILEFKKIFETMEESCKILPAQSILHESTLEKIQIHHEKANGKMTIGLFTQIFFGLRKEDFYIVAVLFIGLAGIGILTLQKTKENNQNQLQQVLQQPSIQQSAIRSDLVIPEESALLSRS